MPGVSASGVLDWPYIEGLRLDEAMHPLTLVAVGLYGEVLPNQNGAPLRLVVPWKYGFKSIKSIVRIRLVETQPKTAWNDSAPQEYGFYSNVNPNGRSSALEPGDRAAHRRVLQAEDADVQRLRRSGRVDVRRDGSEEVLLTCRVQGAGCRVQGAGADVRRAGLQSGHVARLKSRPAVA